MTSAFTSRILFPLWGMKETSPRLLDIANTCQIILWVLLDLTYKRHCVLGVRSLFSVHTACLWGFTIASKGIW